MAVTSLFMTMLLVEFVLIIGLSRAHRCRDDRNRTRSGRRRDASLLCLKLQKRSIFLRVEDSRRHLLKNDTFVQSSSQLASSRGRIQAIDHLALSRIDNAYPATSASTTPTITMVTAAAAPPL